MAQKEPTDKERIEAAAALEKSVRGLTGVVADLGAKIHTEEKKNKKNRFWITLTIAGLLLDIILTVAIFHYQSVTSTAVKDNKKAVLLIKKESFDRCTAGNQARLDDLALWTPLLNTPPPPNETPTEKARREATTAQFTTLLHRKDALQDCSKI